MKVTLGVLLLLLCPFSLADNSEYKTLVSKTEVRDFAPGHTIRLGTGGGEVKIRPGIDDKHITLHYTLRSNNSDFEKKVKLRFNANPESAADINLDFPSSSGSVDIDLEVPAFSNLRVRMLAGDLSVDKIAGNKDMELHFGDLKVRLPDKPNFHHFDASVHIGDVSAAGLGEPKGWLGKKLVREGDGVYDVHLHVGTGDIVVR